MKRPLLLHFTDEEAEACLRSAKLFHSDDDLPDPLDRVDCYRRPDLVAAEIRRREIQGQVWGAPSTISYPKISGGTRQLIALDPSSELFYRLLVAPVRLADRRLSDGILHARVANIKSVDWHVKPWRIGQKQLRNLRADWKRRHVPVGLLDIKNHYATIQVRSLTPILYSCSDLDPHVMRLAGHLQLLHDMPGIPSGLPVSREPSAILGTLALLPLDHAISRHCSGFVRWMDDVRIPGLSESQFEHLVAVATEQLHLIGQELNLEKSRWPEDEVHHDPYALLIEDDHMSCEEAARILRSVAENDDYSQVNWALAVLGYRGDPRGLEILNENIDIFYRTPTAVSRYLRSVTPHLDAWESLLDLLHLNEHDHHDIVLVHLAHVMPSELLTVNARNTIFDIAMEAYEESRFALASFLFVLSMRGAQGQSAVRLRTRAFDLTQEMGDLNVRRALLTGLRTGGSLPRRVRRQVAEFGKDHPELAYTTDWVLAS